MGSKTIIFLGVLISAIYLYFCINKYAVVESKTNIPSDAVVQTVDEVKQKKVEKAPAIIEEDMIQNANERISTPAFGFMAGTDKNQIVALMSDNDENGLLSKEIAKLCQKKECSNDMRYEKDIIDASWQKEIIQIIELLTDGSIENGSLFIEGNVLKLEGTVNSQKAQNLLSDILTSVKSGTLKIENYSKLSDNVKKVDVEKKKEVKKVNQKTAEKTKVEKLKPNPVVVKHSIDKSISAVKSVSKVHVKTTNTKKRVPKTKSSPKPEIVPAPVMETTLDAEARVRAILGEIKDRGSKVGVVAKPHMETTIDNKDK